MLLEETKRTCLIANPRSISLVHYPLPYTLVMQGNKENKNQLIRP